MTTVSSIYTRARRCPLAHSMALTTIIFFGITLYYAIEQKTVMLSSLAEPIIAVLLGLPTVTAFITFVVGSKCRMKFAKT